MCALITKYNRASTLTGAVNLLGDMLVLLTALLSTSSAQGVQDSYCNHEQFNATCAVGHVVYMASARYGRMELGTCLKKDVEMGCFRDVKSVLDTRCSGRRQCSFSIPDAELSRGTKCHSDYSMYLQATYECLPVATADGAPCHGAVHIPGTSGHIASSATLRSTVGSPSCPWLIRASPGQTINVTLIDYTSGSAVPHGAANIQETTGRLSSSHPDCISYATIREHESDEYTSICRGQNIVFSSKTNAIEIAINVNLTGVNFLLKYEATGCADREAPVGGRVERNGDTLTLSCNHSQERFHLICKRTEWVGVFPNCTTAPQTGSTDKTSTGTNPSTGEKNFPFGLLIAIGIGVVIGVVLGFVFLIIVFTFRRRRQTSGRETSLLVEGQTYATGDNQRNAYKLVEVSCQRPVPDLACDCAQAELASQTHISEDKRDQLAKQDYSTMGRMVHCDYEMAPKLLTEELLKGTLHKCTADDCPHDDWTPHDVYRTHQQPVTYPRLGRPLVSFNTDQTNCGTVAPETPHTLQRGAVHQHCPDCQPLPPPPGDLQYYNGS